MDAIEIKKKKKSPFWLRTICGLVAIQLRMCQLGFGAFFWAIYLAFKKTKNKKQGQFKVGQNARIKNPLRRGWERKARKEGGGGSIEKVRRGDHLASEI